MALIECPECRREISNKASTCPHCGLKLKKILNKVILFSLIFLCISAITATGIFFSLEAERKKQPEKYPLFNMSYVLRKTDPYGLSNENNIIGKEISEILFGYVENKDYTVTSSENLVTYKFPISTNVFTVGLEPELMIYVPNNCSVIDSVGYSFRFKDDTALSVSLFLYKDELTEYYDVDPVYSYSSEQKTITTDKDTFYSFINNDDFKTTYTIKWQSGKGTAQLSFTELYDEKMEYGTIKFTGGISNGTN